MKRRIIGLLLCLLGFALAGTPGANGGVIIDRGDTEQMMSEYAPVELAHFQQCRLGGYNRPTAEAAVALVKKLQEVARQCRKEKNARAGRAQVAPRFGWEMVIKCWQETGDAEAKALLLSAWDASLAQELKRSLSDMPNTRLQVSALLWDWQPAFLTPKLIGAFKQAKDPMVIHAFCLLFEQHGREAELALLKAKRPALKDIMKPESAAYKTSLSNLDRAIRGIEDALRYGEEGIRFGPAAAPSVPQSAKAEGN
jgi:hypothetical protein